MSNKIFERFEIIFGGGCRDYFPDENRYNDDGLSRSLRYLDLLWTIPLKIGVRIPTKGRNLARWAHKRNRR